MLPRGDDKDEDDFHLFTRRFTACRYRYPTIIYDIEVLLIWGLLNHFMNMKVGTPDDSSAFLYSYLYIH